MMTPAERFRRAVCIAAIVLPAAHAGCARSADADDVITLRFWGMGREGEVVAELIAEFEREAPDIRVRTQQIPWTAAHEKLLTAFVGNATPDVAQLGNTWIAEFAAIHALEPLNTRVAASTESRPTRSSPASGRRTSWRHRVGRALVRRHARRLLPLRSARGGRLRRDPADVGGLAWRRCGR
jgi:hypothetical protein